MTRINRRELFGAALTLSAAGVAANTAKAARAAALF